MLLNSIHIALSSKAEGAPSKSVANRNKAESPSGSISRKVA